MNLVKKRCLRVLWLVFILSCLTFYLFNPNFFQAEQLAHWLGRNEVGILWVYALVSMLRGLTLVPATPFVLAGALLFPQQLWLVLLVSVLGIVISALLIYYGSVYLGFEAIIRKKYAHKLDKITAVLQGPRGFWFVLFWSFFPIVPTDAISYVAGVIRLSLWSFLLALFLGEFLICWFYIYGLNYFWS